VQVNIFIPTVKDEVSIKVARCTNKYGECPVELEFEMNNS
jgi:hypothetical protein